MNPLALVLIGAAAFVYAVTRLFEAQHTLDDAAAHCDFDEHCDQAIAIANGTWSPLDQLQWERHAQGER